jgi:hypothetical protein
MSAMTKPDGVRHTEGELEERVRRRSSSPR